MPKPFLVSRRLFVAVLAVLALALLPPAQLAHGQDAGFSKEKLDAVAALLQKAVDDKKMAGGSALIGHRGKVVYRVNAGLADVEAKVLVADDTIFRIASMTKPITSVAIMILVDDGKLATTDPLSKFVPEFKDMKVLVPDKDGKSYTTVPATREITVHDLLTHSSGITYRLMNKPHLGKLYADAGISDGLAETPGTVGDTVRKLAKLPLTCQPGSAWEYGLNTDVLGHIVEVVSGKTLEEFFRERIFGPLKMDDTWFILPKEKRSRLAALYAAGMEKTLTRTGEKSTTVPGGPTFSATYPTNDGSKYFSGGGGLSSSAGDYFRFSQMMLNRGELDGARILKAETVERMTRNQLGDIRIPFPGADVMGYGFGVLSDDSKSKQKDPAGVGTYGWGGAFGTFFWIDPKNELVGVFMTQVFPPDFTMATQFKKLAYDALSGTK
jgi:CubicO group peptidase (beta-lactamase class C family)